MDAIECFRKNLKELMKEGNLNFESLGKKVKINPSTMRRWYDKSIPKAESLVKIADFFGCSCDFLLGFTETFEFTPGKIQTNFYTRYSLLLGRIRAKGTDNKIAKFCGIGRTTVFNWRKGKIPDVYILVKLCEIFDCSFEYLIGRSEY